MVSDTSWYLKTSPCVRSVWQGWKEMAHPYCPSETALSTNVLGEDGGATTHSRMPDLDTQHSCKNKVTFCSVSNSWIVSTNVHNLFVSRCLCWSCFYKQWSNISRATYRQQAVQRKFFCQIVVTWPGVELCIGRWVSWTLSSGRRWARRSSCSRSLWQPLWAPAGPLQQPLQQQRPAQQRKMLRCAGQPANHPRHCPHRSCIWCTYFWQNKDFGTQNQG